MLKYLIGIDVGGTNIKVMIMDTGLTVIGKRSFPTSAEDGYDMISDRIITNIDCMLAEKNIDRSSVMYLAMGLLGIVDRKAQKTIYLSKLKWDGFNPAAKLGQYYQVPTAIDNDANINALGEYAFGECYGLERVDIKEGLSYIGFGAFSNSGLGEIRLPDSVQGVDMEAFAHCQNLRKVELSSNLRGISDRMFYDCTELLSVLFNNDTSNLAFIGAGAFENCRRVNIRIPQSVTGIAPMAFMGSGITEIVIPNGVTWNNPDGNRVIADSTFKDCQILYTVEIDKNIEVIENQAFYGCKNLNDIRYNGTMEEWKEIKKGAGWDYDTGDYKVYCSDGTLDKNGNVAVNP